MEEFSMHIQPGRSVGFMTLGCSLHEILTTIKAEVKAFPRFQLYYDDVRPIDSPIQLALPDNGLRLQFDGPDQRLRLIEVLDFTKAKLVYKDVEVFKPSDGNSGGLGATPGPRFRHIYDKLLGPTYGGEYIPPKSEDPNARGTYNLSYPGVAFNFSVHHAAYSPKKDFISLLSSSATGPATSMAVFAGESWQKARATLFTATPPNPRSLAVTKSKDGPDEIELVKIHGQGKIELVRRSSPPFIMTLGETTPQDLIMELGAPDSIYRKHDHRLSIHKHRRTSDVSDVSPLPVVDDSSSDSDPSSALHTDDASSTWSSASSTTHNYQHTAAEHFYNYYHHGFDILLSQPTEPHPATTPTPNPTTTTIPHHLTATKLILHGNIPGSYPFNRHRRSRWVIPHIAILSSSPSPSPSPPLNHHPAKQHPPKQHPPKQHPPKQHPPKQHSPTVPPPNNPLTSSHPFHTTLAPALQSAFHTTYDSPEQERLLQRGMALNRGWGDSPGSSCELLGMGMGGMGGLGMGMEDSGSVFGGGGGAGGGGGGGTVVMMGMGMGRGGSGVGVPTTTTTGAGVAGDEVGNVELFGFPGLVFEVLKNGAVSALTVY